MCYFVEITPWNTGNSTKLIVSWMVRISLSFMEPEISLPYSEHAPLDSNHSKLYRHKNITPSFFKKHFNIIIPSTPNLTLSSGEFTSGFPTEIRCVLLPLCVISVPTSDYTRFHRSYEVSCYLFFPLSRYFFSLRPEHCPQHRSQTTSIYIP